MQDANVMNMYVSSTHPVHPHVHTYAYTHRQWTLHNYIHGGTYVHTRLVIPSVSCSENLQEGT